MAKGDVRGTLTGGAGSTADPSSATGSVAISDGDLLFACVCAQNAGFLLATDNLGNTWAPLTDTSTDGALTGRAHYSYVTEAGTLTQVDLDTSGASGNNWAVLVVVYEGPFNATPLDANPANGTGDTTSPFTCPATGTLAQADELVVAWASVFITGSLAATSPNLLSGEASDGGSRKATIGAQVVAATTTVSPEFTSANTPTDIVLGTASFKFAASGSTYTLDADAGSYAISGTDAALEFDRQVVADAGSYAISGTDAAPEYDRQVVADAGSYAISGTDAALEFDRQIVADAGSYAINGTDADLTYTPIGAITLDADAGSYLIGGTDAVLTYTQLQHYTLDADPGSYLIGGTAAVLTWSGEPVAAPSAYGGGHDEYTARVRAHWERIEALRAENREREAAQAEQERALEARRQALAEIEAVRSRKRRSAAQRARDAQQQAIQREIADAERQTALLAEAIGATLAEIGRIQAEIAAVQTLTMQRRRAAMVLLLAAAN